MKILVLPRQQFLGSAVRSLLVLLSLLSWLLNQKSGAVEDVVSDPAEVGVVVVMEGTVVVVVVAGTSIEGVDVTDHHDAGLARVLLTEEGAVAARRTATGPVRNVTTVTLLEGLSVIVVRLPNPVVVAVAEEVIIVGEIEAVMTDVTGTGEMTEETTVGEVMTGRMTGVTTGEVGLVVAVAVAVVVEGITFGTVTGHVRNVV